MGTNYGGRVGRVGKTQSLEPHFGRLITRAVGFSLYYPAGCGRAEPGGTHIGVEIIIWDSAVELTAELQDIFIRPFDIIYEVGAV